MFKGLTFLVLLVASGGNAFAQIGDPFARGRPNGQAMWQGIGQEQMSCIDATLRRGDLPATLNEMIARGISPNSYPLDRIARDCRDATDPKFVQPSDTIRGPSWATYTVEQKMAFFAEYAWFLRTKPRANYKCNFRVDRDGSYPDEKACIAKAGFTFSAESPQSCMLKISERIPLRPDLPTKWDGKPSSIEVVGRELTIPLMALHADLIQRRQAAFDLYFEVTAQRPAQHRILLSDGSLVDIPPPPDGTGPDRMNRLMQWSTEARRFGNPLVAGYEFSGFSPMQETNSEEGLRRIQANSGRMFLKVESAQFSPMMAEAFVQTVKSLIEKCRQ